MYASSRCQRLEAKSSVLLASEAADILHAHENTGAAVDVTKDQARVHEDGDISTLR